MNNVSFGGVSQNLHSTFSNRVFPMYFHIPFRVGSVPIQPTMALEFPYNGSLIFKFQCIYHSIMFEGYTSHPKRMAYFIILFHP